MQPHERMAALAELRAIEDTLSRMSAWLDREGYERASVLTEDATRSLWAAQCLLDRNPDQVLKIVPHGRALNAQPNGAI